MASIPKIDRVTAPDIQGLQGVNPGFTNTSGLDAVGNAVEGFGNTISGVGDDLIAVGAANQARDEDRIGRDGSTELSRRLLEERFGTPGQQGTQGGFDEDGQPQPGLPGTGTEGWSSLGQANAVDARDGVLDRAQKIHQEILDGMPAGRARDLYAQKAQQILLGYDADNAKHTAAERDKAEVTSLTSQGDVAERSFNLAPDATTREVYKDDIITAEIAKMDFEGFTTDPDARTQRIRERMSLVYKRAVTAQLNARNHAGAKALLEEGKASAFLTVEDQGKLENSVLTETQTEEAQVVSDTALALFKGDAAQQRDYIKKHSKGDVREKALVMQSRDLAAQDKQKVRAEKSAREQAYAEAAAGKTVDKMDQHIKQAVGPRLAAWLNKVAVAAAGGSPLHSDGKTYNTLLTQWNRDPTGFAAVDLTEHNLTTSEFEKLTLKQESTNSALGVAQAKDKKAVEQAASLKELKAATSDLSHMTGKRGKQKSAYLGLTRTQSSVVLDQALAELEKLKGEGVKVSSQQMRDIYKSLSVKVRDDNWEVITTNIENSIRKGKVPSLDILDDDPEMKANVVRMSAQANVSPEQGLVLSAILRSQGRVPTAAGIAKLQRQRTDAAASAASPIAVQRRDAAIDAAINVPELGVTPPPIPVPGAAPAAPATPPADAAVVKDQNRRAASAALKRLRNVDRLALTPELRDKVLAEELEAVQVQDAEEAATADRRAVEAQARRDAIAASQEQVEASKADRGKRVEALRSRLKRRQDEQRKGGDILLELEAQAGEGSETGSFNAAENNEGLDGGEGSETGSFNAAENNDGLVVGGTTGLTDNAVEIDPLGALPKTVTSELVGDLTPQGRSRREETSVEIGLEEGGRPQGPAPTGFSHVNPGVPPSSNVKTNEIPDTQLAALPAASRVLADKHLTAVHFIANYEKFLGKAKLFKNETRYTIGYGNTDNVKKGDTITKPEATKQLVERTERVWKEVQSKVDKSVLDQLSEDQKAAIVSLVYNSGWTFPTGLAALNRGDIDEFILHAFDSDTGVTKQKDKKGVFHKIAGLVNRRADERRLFIGTGNE